MGHQVIKLQNPLKTLGFLQFYRFKTVKDRIIALRTSIWQPQNNLRHGNQFSINRKNNV